MEKDNEQQGRDSGCTTASCYAFQYYRKKGLQPMRPYREGETLSKNVSISKADSENGSPKEGDMIAININDPSDMWLIAKDFFENNYEKSNKA